MTLSQPNLFQSLFAFHPRECHTPKENFLTESFAYLLRTDGRLCSAWLSRLLGIKADEAVCEIWTRGTERDVEAKTAIYPDMLIKGQLADRKHFAIYSEHKWDSACDRGQLKKYAKLAQSQSAGIVFIAASYKQISDAGQCLPKSACFLWEQVYETLDALCDKSPLLMEFLTFMKTHGLSPAQPLTIERMKAFLQASDFIRSLENLVNKLRLDYSWDGIPKRFLAETYVHTAYGRVGIRFETPDWRPALTVGLLYDTTDHKVAFINPERGIDLMLRIEAEPKNTTTIQPALDVLNKKRTELRKTAASVLLKGERGNGNPYSVLIARDCLANVISDASTAADQLNLIHERLTTWLKILFKDGTLEGAFKKSGLDSGMV
jgi:hypothetical protein